MKIHRNHYQSSKIFSLGRDDEYKTSIKISYAPNQVSLTITTFHFCFHGQNCFRVWKVDCLLTVLHKIILFGVYKIEVTLFVTHLAIPKVNNISYDFHISYSIIDQKPLCTAVNIQWSVSQETLLDTFCNAFPFRRNLCWLFSRGAVRVGQHVAHLSTRSMVLSHAQDHLWLTTSVLQLVMCTLHSLFYKYMLACIFQNEHSLYCVLHINNKKSLPFKNYRNKSTDFLHKSWSYTYIGIWLDS